MPELPEVEVIKKGFQNLVVDKTIFNAEFLHLRTIRDSDESLVEFAKNFKNLKVKGLYRRGKYLWLQFDNYEKFLIIHLGMSGQILYKHLEDEPSRTTRAVFVLGNENPEYKFFFNDQRTFGRIFWSEKEFYNDNLLPKKLDNIAPDIFSIDFSLEKILNLSHTKTTNIKSFLLNQNYISGIGNIYADEILFASKVNPFSKVNKIPKIKINQILEYAKIIMEQSINMGGTSFDYQYKNVFEDFGSYQNNLKVYGRKNQSCLVCGTKLSLDKIGGRTTIYCSFCQEIFN